MSCKYCNGDKPLHDYGKQSLSIVNGWTNKHGWEFPGWQLKYDSCDTDFCFSVHVKYCPWCGEKLGDVE
jgi:hypothetical protein